MNSARAFASSVFPTPVGPRKMNEPIGRFGSLSPARARRTAFEIISMASCWPMTRLWISSSMWSRRADSSSAIRVTGIPVHIATTWAISSSSTVGWSPATFACHSPRRVSTFSRAEVSASRRSRRVVVLLGVDGRVLVADDPLELLLGLPEIRRRRGVAEADAAGRLVDQVDRLVGQMAVRDVADRQVGGSAHGGVVDRDLVVLLVALADPEQDLDRLLERRLLDHDRLEPPLEGGVALDVLAVLVERRRADALELATGQRRLEDVRRVDRALGRARPDEGVELVDEQDGVVGVAKLLDDLLEALLELAAVLRARDQRPDVEGQHPLPEQGVRDVVRDDAMGQPLGDGGLADARLADQRRVVLRLAPEDLDDPLDLLLAPDHGIELAGPGGVGQVDAELIDGRRLGGSLGLGRGAGGGALGEDPDHLVADLVEADPEGLEDARGDPLALADKAQEQVLGADVVVAEPACLVDRELDHPLGTRRQADLADDGPVAPSDDELDRGPHLGELDVHVLEDARGHAFALADEAEEQVLRADVVVIEPLRLVLGESQDLARAIRELVKSVHRDRNVRSGGSAALLVMLARPPCQHPGPYRSGQPGNRPSLMGGGVWALGFHLSWGRSRRPEGDLPERPEWITRPWPPAPAGRGSATPRGLPAGGAGFGDAPPVGRRGVAPGRGGRRYGCGSSSAGGASPSSSAGGASPSSSAGGASPSSSAGGASRRLGGWRLAVGLGGWRLAVGLGLLELLPDLGERRGQRVVDAALRLLDGVREGVAPLLARASRARLGHCRAGRRLLGLLEAQAQAMALGIEADDLELEDLALADDVARMGHALVGQLADVDEAFEAVAHPHESAEVDELGDRALDDVTDPEVRDGRVPGVGLEAADREADPAALVVDVDDLGLDLVTDLVAGFGVVDLVPRELALVDEAIDAAQVDEDAERRDRADVALDLLADLEAAEELVALLAPLLVERNLLRQDETVRLPIDLEDLEPEAAADVRLQLLRDLLGRVTRLLVLRAGAGSRRSGRSGRSPGSRSRRSGRPCCGR